MKVLFLRLWKEEAGQDLTEYALLLVLISLSAIATMDKIAASVEKVFTQSATNLTSSIT